MNITVLSQYFPPEMGAPSARISEMTKEWAKDGHAVEVVTAFPNYPDGIIPEEYRGFHYLCEEIDGVMVHRNYTYATPNKGFFKRIFASVCYMASSVLLSIGKIRNPDVVVATSPPLFTLFSGYLYSRLKKAPLVLDIRDLWPAAIVELGVIHNRFIIFILEKCELFLYRKSSRIVVVTTSFKQDLLKRGIPADKIDVITNGCNTELFYPAKKDKTLLRGYHLSGKFVVLYVGTHGLSQGLEKVLDTAERLKEYNDIHFLFVGEGARKKNLIAIKKQKKLQNVTFVKAQPKEIVAEFYRMGSVGLVTHKNIELFRAFIPSKMFEIMGCGIPLIASVRGEAADIINQSETGLVVEPEDSEALAEAILKLKNSPEEAKTMGKNGVNYVKQHYSRVQLAKKYEAVLKKATNRINES